ncbi:hypothetical protein K9M48_00110 [Candidatus Gracilibacteria bacterium]|nr:hypothetical protein [Candidatus Gracilibacteria bacterium]
MNVDELKKINGWAKFDSIYKNLVALLGNVQKSDFISEVKKLNDTAKGIIGSLKDEANKAISALQKNINDILASNVKLQKANDAVNAVRERLGVKEADMVLVHTNPMRSWSLLIGAVAVALLDYLIGGVIIFASNQSIQVTGMLMLAAILAAIFYAMAAPAFAINRRLYKEIDLANQRMKENGAMQALIQDDPATVLPNFLKPYEEILPHNEGSIYFNLDKGEWELDRNNVWAWFWLGMGTILSFIRLIPIIATPELYGEGAIWSQLLLLIVALIVNFIIFALEYRRRDQTGLPNQIQSEINNVVSRRDAILKSEDADEEMENLEKEISEILSKTQKELDEAKDDYQSDFALITAKAGNYAVALEKYKKAYNECSGDITTFYNELNRLNQISVKSKFEKDIPNPVMVEAMYPSPTGNESGEFKLSGDLFKISVKSIN